MVFKFVLVICLFFYLVAFHMKNYDRVDEELKPRAAPGREIKHLTFGYADIFADIFWLRVLQRMFCEQNLTPDGERDAGIRMGQGRTPDCRFGYVFAHIDVVTELAPRFKTPHLAGPELLSVVVDDIAGATVIYDKATRRFSDDWRIFFSAGYHYLMELEDTETAANLYMEAARKGAPAWVIALSARLYSENKRYEFAYHILNDYKKRYDHLFVRQEDRDRVEERLEEIRSKIKE